MVGRNRDVRLSHHTKECGGTCFLTEQKQLMKTVPTESPSSDFWLRQNLISFLKASMSKTMCKTDTTPVNTSLRTHGFVS